MKRIRLIALLLTAVFTATSLAACSGEASQSTPTNESASTAQEDAQPEGSGNSDVNPTGFPIVNEPITLTVFGARDQNQAEWKDVLVLKEYEKMTGIHMDYQEVPGGDSFKEKKALLFASGDLPDIFLRCSFEDHEIGKYGATTGQFMALDDLIAQYAPNLSAVYADRPDVQNSVKAADGKMYTIPELDFSAAGSIGFKQWINKEWLAAVGKEVPTTLDEFKAVLIAFRDEDPNGNGEADEIPLGIREPNSVFELGGSFGLGYQMKEPCNIDENGRISYWLTDDRYKEYLMWLNELYSEKLIWQDYYKNDRPAWRSNLANALFGAFYMPYSDVFINVEDQFIGFDPIPGPHGDRMWSHALSGIDQKGAFALSNTCAYPEAAIRWVDYFYGEEGALFFRFGIEGETYHMDENGEPRINDDILGAPEGFMTALGKINLVPGKGFPCLTTDQNNGTSASDLTKQVSADLIPFLPERIYSKPAVSEEDNERINMIDQDLINYRDESAAKFIIGEWGFDKWEEYCQAIEQIGLPEKQEILQRALDAQL